jgi:uncharacterized protein YyaL (SSP411 family)
MVLDEASRLVFEAPFLRGMKQINGRATAYVCRDFTCRQPVNEPDALRAELQS